MTVINYYAGGSLDRASAVRKNPAALAERLAHPATRLVPWWRGRHLIAEQGDGIVAVHLTMAEARHLVDEAPIFLGDEEGAAYFALDLSALDESALPPQVTARGRLEELRPLAPRLGTPAGSLFAYVRALMHWHTTHRFCGSCGGPTEVIDGGHARHCLNPACGATIFPRTDPVVIMLVHDNHRCLLGRQSRFPPSFYSTLAGFVEPGESLEEAVAREVLEESGIHVTDVHYHSSQPWPFPGSLMLGFHARATSRDITIDRDELEDAQWFERDWIRDHLDTDAFRVPPPQAIARQLINAWLNGDVS
jgi:NAD+ diphosphatase